MKISIKSLLRGAREARGHVALIDVFTATTAAVALLERGATRIIPMRSAQRARALRAREEGTVLMGERWGKKLPGFDHNTSAVRASALDVAGRQVVLSTTNGTLGMLSAESAERLFLGCFRNLEALVRHLADADEITLVPIGLAHGSIKAIEDEVCAEAVRRRLVGEPVDSAGLQERIRRDLSSRLRNIGRQKDVEYCLEFNVSEIVPELLNGIIVPA